MTMIFLDHCRKELPHHPEMRDSIDLKRLLDDLFRTLQNRKASSNTSIIDQNSWITMIFPDLLCRLRNLRRRRNVTLIKEHPRRFTLSATLPSYNFGAKLTQRSLRRIQIQNNNLYPPPRKVLRHQLANPVRAPANQHQFLTLDELRIFLPIIRYPLAQFPINAP
jgi:hypothetical protein